MKVIIVDVDRYVKKTINLEFVKREPEEVEYDDFHYELELIEKTIQRFLGGRQ